MLKQSEKIDITNEEKVKSVVSFMVLKKLISPVTKSKAFKLGIVDKDGKKIKDPETKEEELSYTLFDKLMFRVKYLLGGRAARLNRFIYLQTILDDDFYKRIVVTGGVEKRAAVKRVQQDIEALIEQHGLEYEEFYDLLIAEEIYEHKKKKEK